MPSGVYIRTEETKKKISETHMGHLVTEETRKKMSISQKGKKFPKEKYPNYAGRGKQGWSKGLTKETDKRLIKAGRNISKALMGHITTEETRIKISQSRKGKYHTEETKENLKKNMKKRWQNPKYRKAMEEIHIGQIAWNKGLTKNTDERVANYGRNSGKSRKGKPTWNNGLTALTDKRIRKSKIWQGGVSNLPYGFEFNNQLKELIRYRDNYKCQLCGMPEIENNQKLSIHHIDYNKKNSRPNNLITLCIKCNSKVNHDRDKWENYFVEKIKKVMNQNKMQLDSIFNLEEKKRKA